MACGGCGVWFGSFFMLGTAVDIIDKFTIGKAIPNRHPHQIPKGIIWYLDTGSTVLSPNFDAKTIIVIEIALSQRLQ